MTQTEAKEIARSLHKRHVVLYRSQKFLVTNVSFALAYGMPVSQMDLSLDIDAPIMQGARDLSVSYRKVALLPTH